MKALSSPFRSLALVTALVALHASCSLIADSQLEGKPSASTSSSGNGGTGGDGAGSVGGAGSGGALPCDGTCLANETCCSGACFDLEKSSDHCGSCDKACVAGEKCCGGGTCAACCDATDCPTTDHQCIGGACILMCTNPAVDCGDECAILATTTKHCGSCDNDCLSGHPCIAGKCQSGWAVMNQDGAPAPRQRAAATWTGSALFVWGGKGDQGALGDGALYDPKTDTWSPLATDNAPSPRMDAVAVLIDKQRVMVWGGGPHDDNVGLNSGKLYDLVTSTWTDLPVSVIGRRNPVATWTGSKVLIWGGTSGGAAIAGGAYYDPAMTKWTMMSNPNSPTARTGVGWAWSGQELLLFGGRPGGVGATADGFGYNPETNVWRKLPTPAMLEPRFDTFVAWTGTSMLVFGGRDIATTYANAALYDPAMDAWTSAKTNPLGKRSAPAPRAGCASSGSPQILVAGGLDQWEAIKTDGRVYDSVVNDWGAQIPAWPSGVDHEYGVCIWTGAELILWSGFENAQLVPVGERYRP